MDALLQLHQRVRNIYLLKWFTWGTRILLALGFTPSGWKKLAGQRFTMLDIDTSVGFFFEALYRAGFYWNFLGLMQLLAAVLLLIPRTAFLGALLYFPIIINIFIIVTAMDFTGTPYVVGLMVLANVYLLCWDYPKLKKMVQVIFEP